MYRPDPRIVRYLKEYDRDLDARWDRDRERWWVTYRGKPALLMQYPDGSYMPLDERAVTKVKLSDSHRYDDARKMLRVMDEENHRITESQRRKWRDDTRQFWVEDGPARYHFDGRNKFAGWSPS